MPTKHQRIGVVKDEELSAALDSVEALVEPDTPAAALVHDLAVRGAEALRDEERERRENVERLVEWSTGATEPPWDPDVLAGIDELTQE